ncbi:MAG TPA: DegV family protein [Anaerolineaceae bacterium]|mgnify:CR=1 FL=1|nr:DegV family protein [Anaerolineaceae bacterium]HPN52520.1 DegV family protein [Anaerolineaceae bacterium]
MGKICIVTDQAVQFTRAAFQGQRDVVTIPLKCRLDNGSPQEARMPLPATARNGLKPQLLVPSSEEIYQVFAGLAGQYQDVIAIFHSSGLSPLCDNALQAADRVRGLIPVQVIDSLSLSVGMGYLVQIAAEAAAAGRTPASQIEHKIRGLTPHIYSAFCIPGLSYLYHAGVVDYAQAVVGEMLGLLPIFSMEDGHLTPLEKMRSYRNVVDFFQEFLDEFTDLAHISIIQSVPNLSHENHSLREHAMSNFSKSPFTEHAISLPIATLFGPRTMGVVAIENPNAREFA